MVGYKKRGGRVMVVGQTGGTLAMWGKMVAMRGKMRVTKKRTLRLSADLMISL